LPHIKLTSFPSWSFPPTPFHSLPSFIKDANTVAARAACYLEAQRRICLTGTPIQNKLDDLWALIKFIRLEPFDDKSVWAQYVSSPAKYGDSIGVARLQVIMRHITLRRTKETKLASGESLLNLPPRKDEIRYLTFSEKEAEIYQKEFEESKNDFSNMLKGEEQGAGGGTAQSSSTVGGVRGEAGGGSAPAISNTNYVNILQKILRLRQICDHYLLINDSSLSADDDLASDEPLEYEEAAAAIALSGMTQRRAGAVMTFMKEERMCECVECKVDLGCLAAPGIGGEASDKPEEEAVELGEDGKPVKKGRGRVAKKKIPQAVLTKCQHLYCTSKRLVSLSPWC
jgi:SWI/SNF-related matrix-associated actin-dependent regulator of chromatin subfamily A3